MTRKKERDKASIDYADKFMSEVNKINDEQWKWAQKHPDEPTVAGGVKACWIFQRSAFLAGAEWADANPVHYDGKAYLYVLHKGVEQGRREMLDEVCEWLKENGTLYWWDEEDDEGLNDLRKAMEGKK